MKIEFKRRLIRLAHEIERACIKNSIDYGLLPALWSVVSYLWSGDNARKKK